MDERYKEVYFDKYCETCEYKNTKHTDDPCDGCLEHPMNLCSHKPINYKKQKTKAIKKTKKD